MLHASHLPKGLWAEVLMHAIWLKNCTSTKGLEQGTPYEALTGNKPDLAHLHEWGQKVWVHDGASSKLNRWAKEEHWVRFDSETKGHCIFWPNRPRVSVKCNVRSKHDHVLITELPTHESKPTQSHHTWNCQEQNNCLTPRPANGTGWPQVTHYQWTWSQGQAAICLHPPHTDQ